MNLLATFRMQAAARSLGRRTVSVYEFWIKKFWAQTGQWNGQMVTRWMADLSAAGYSRVSRKIARQSPDPRVSAITTLPGRRDAIQLSAKLGESRPCLPIRSDLPALTGPPAPRTHISSLCAHPS
jgi:hypothetical protein